MKNILVPTDFSENCNKASYLGIKIAKLFDAEIHFLHLMKTPVDWVKLDKQKEKLYPETLKQIGKAKAALRALERAAEKEGLNVVNFFNMMLDMRKYWNIQDIFITIISLPGVVVPKVSYEK